jgi:competence ComEA-like helix-hairpin-helix protein
MKEACLILFVLLLASSSVYAICNEGQIDINTASAEELDLLPGIGPVKAVNIINTRPFSSVDDLIKVSGIGNTTLTKIKEQDLACVEDSEKKEVIVEEIIEETEEVIENVTEILDKPAEETAIPEETKAEKSPLEAIKLTPKSIKSEDDKEKISKKDYLKYGFVFFCILIGILFIIKGNRYKNEFN